jgi:hypothetical protein
VLDCATGIREFPFESISYRWYALRPLNSGVCVLPQLTKFTGIA